MPSLTPNYDFYLPLVNNATDSDLWGGYLNDNFSSLDTILTQITPPASVMPYAGSTEPSGWLFCYGQAVSRSTYSTLFGVIGITYGAGDTTTTFNLPDLRGRAVAARDDMGGSAAGRITSGVSGIDGTALGAAGGDQNSQSHIHTVSPQIGLLASATGSSPIAIPANPGLGSYNTDFYGTGNSQNVQPTIILNYIIKT